MAWQISILKALQNWTSKNGWFSHKPWWFYILFISIFSMFLADSRTTVQFLLLWKSNIVCGKLCMNQTADIVRYW